MTAAARRSRKKPDISIAELAAVPFQPLPEAVTLGRNAEEWRRRFDDMRLVVVFAGSVLSKTPAELRQAIRNTDWKAWTQMLDAFNSATEEAKGLLALLEGAHARGLIALAGIAEPGAVAEG